MWRELSGFSLYEYPEKEKIYEPRLIHTVNAERFL